MVGGRKLQRTRVYGNVPAASAGAQESLPKRDDGDDAASSPSNGVATSGRPSEDEYGRLRHDDSNSQLDFDAVDDVDNLFQGDHSMPSGRDDDDDDDVEPDSAVDDDDDDDDEASADRQYAREVALLEANRQVFEEAKQSVLDQLPPSYVEQFGQVGFGRYAKKYYPAMMLGPYDVPDYVRSTWMTSFEKMKRQDRLESIRTVCIVFWYGAEPKDCFSIIKPSEFVTYEEGMQRKVLDKEYESALQKKEAGDKLGRQEKILVNGMQLLLDDVAIPQHERNRKKLDFYEEYEYIDKDELSDVDVPQKKRKMARPPKKQKLDANEPERNELVESSADDVPQKKRKRGRQAKEPKLDVLDGTAKADKPKPVKKPRRRSSNASELMFSGDGAANDDKHDLTVAEPPVKERKKPGRKPGRKPKAPSDQVVGGAEGDGASSVAAPEAKQKKKKKKTLMGNAAAIESSTDAVEKSLELPKVNLPEESLEYPPPVASNVGEIEDIGDAEDDESLDDDRKDANFADSEDDDDSKDDDFEAKLKGSKKFLKTVKPQKKARALKAKQTIVKVKRQVDPVVREKRDYKRCCTDYLPLVQRLEESVAASNFDLVSAAMDDFLEAAANFSAPFLELHVAPVVKMAKQVIKEAKRDDLLKSYKVLNGKLNGVYGQKKALVPTGFTLPKPRKSSATASATVEPVRSTKTTTENSDNADPKLSQAVPPTPERPASQELKSPISRKEPFVKEPSAPETAPPASKAPPSSKVKSFSLGKLGQMIQRDQAPDATAASAAAASQSKSSWLQAPVPNGGGSVAAYTVPDDEDRSLAVEFLRDMAQHLPPDKVDADHMALALENALFDWASSRNTNDSTATSAGRAPWVATYWDRLHAIVAAMSGKKDSSSTLANLVLSGAYSTPMSLVELQEDDFVKSYNGQPIL